MTQINNKFLIRTYTKLIMNRHQKITKLLIYHYKYYIVNSINNTMNADTIYEEHMRPSL